MGGSNEIEIDEQEKNDAYVITVIIPNLKENKIDIKIESDGIFISGDFSQVAERKDSDGNITAKKEMHRSISKSIAVPSDADYSSVDGNNE